VSEKRSRINLPPNEYKNLCTEVLKRDGWKCRICKSRANLHAHHVLFRGRGGDDIRGNLLSVCDFCHDSIHHPNPTTGACVVVLSGGQSVMKKDDAHLVNTDDFEHTQFLLVNGWTPKRRTA
jgi:hypothetical protein